MNHDFITINSQNKVSFKKTIIIAGIDWAIITRYNEAFKKAFNDHISKRHI